MFKRIQKPVIEESKTVGLITCMVQIMIVFQI